MTYMKYLHINMLVKQEQTIQREIKQMYVYLLFFLFLLKRLEEKHFSIVASEAFLLSNL